MFLLFHARTLDLFWRQEKNFLLPFLAWEKERKAKALTHKIGDKMMIACYVFDLDGTIADCSHRLHHIEKKDWRAFFADCDKDEPIRHIIDLVKQLWLNYSIIYVSGRSDECRDLTLLWMSDNGLPDGPIYMRKAGDHRPDHIVKSELLDQLLADGFQPIMAFDDRDQVVKMWRARGIPCAQVAEGNF